MWCLVHPLNFHHLVVIDLVNNAWQCDEAVKGVLHAVSMTRHGYGPTHDECRHVYVMANFCCSRFLPKDIWDLVHKAVDNAENYFLFNFVLKHFKMFAKIKDYPIGTLDNCVIFFRIKIALQYSWNVTITLSTTWSKAIHAILSRNFHQG